MIVQSISPRRLGVLTAALLIACCVQAQNDQPLKKKAPTLRVDARLVVLDFVATDKHGNPVPNLKPSDLHLYEDDAPQTITSFTEHTPADTALSAAIPPTPLPPNTFTNRPADLHADVSTIILIDSQRTSTMWRAQLRKQIVEYLQTNPPNTAMAIFQMDTSLRMVHGLTHDIPSLIAAVQDDRATTAYDLPSYARGHVSHIGTKESLAQIGSYLSGFPGRKNLIWFTNSSVPTNLYHRGYAEQVHLTSSQPGHLSEILTLNRTAIYPVEAHELPAFHGGIGTQWVRGFGAFIDFPPNQTDYSPVEKLAKSSGGDAVLFPDTPKKALARIVDTGSSFYTLTFAPQTHQVHQHRILRVETDLPGVTLHYRNTYQTTNAQAREARKAYAAETTGTPQPTRPQGIPLDKALEFSRIDSTEILFDATITPHPLIFKDKGDVDDGNFLAPSERKRGFRIHDVRFSVDPRSIPLELTPEGRYLGQLQYIALLYDDQETPINSFQVDVPIDLSPEQYEQALRTALVYNQTIAIPVKGKSFLRLAIRDPGGTLTGTLQLPTSAIKLP